MKNRLYKIISLLALVLVLSVPSEPVQAQCPMCRMSAESNLKNGGTAGKGLNKGILYMLSLPYVIVGSVAFIWWRNRIKDEEEFLELE